MTKKGRTTKEQYQWEAKVQWGGRPPLKGELEVDITLYFQDKHKRDWDNWHKALCDSLNGIVYEDDSQIQEAIVRKKIDRDNPRIEIIIKSLEKSYGKLPRKEKTILC